MLFKKWILFLSVLFCLVPAHAQKGMLNIEVTQGMDGALPIAVVPFTLVGGYLPEDVAGVVRNDLGRSGEFDSIPLERMHQHPTDVNSVDFKYWSGLGAENIVIGSIDRLSNNTYKVRYTLVDVFSANENKTNPSQNVVRLSEEFVVEASQLRGLAHHISDRIYETLTGYKGAFSTRIAYVAVEWQNKKLVRYRLEIADVDGYNAKPILSSSEPIMSPSWSPDGSQLAYVSFERKRAEIYISDVRTGGRRLVSNQPGINGAPAWSPDGRKLAIVLSKESSPKIYIMDLQSKQLEQITTGGSIDTEPRFMPDGRSLLFTSNRGGQPQIYQVNLETKSIKRLTYEGSYNARASVTSDGSKMSMIHRTGAGYHIAVQDLLTGNVMVLTRTQLDESPTMSPNGRMVMYGTTDGGRRVLGAVSIDGRVKLLIPASDTEVQEPAWSPFLS